MAGTKPTVLILDDDEMTATAMCRELKLAGYEVAHFSDGSEGLQHALKEEPGLMILDYKMTGTDGLEVLEKLRNNLWGHKAQVLFVTDVYDLGVMNALMLLGVKDYVMKADLAVGQLVKIVDKYFAPAEAAVYANE